LFKQVFRLTFVTFIWKRYKRVLVSTGMLLAFFWLVNFAHDEYLAYAEYQQQIDSINISFLIKWLCLGLGAIIYMVYHFWVPVSFPQSSKDPDSLNKTKPEKVKIPDVDPNEPDPFEQIRNMEKLRTRAEIMIDKNLPSAKK